jgi:hypothetical protein
MTEYRIGERNRKFWIERRTGGDWIIMHERDGVPRYFDSLADARSWVATIKRGVVYHDAEDALSDPLIPAHIKPRTAEMWSFLLVNALRCLTEEQMAGLCIDLYVRSANWQYIDARIKEHKKHSAEDAPNLAQDERKAEDDTSDGIKTLEWFKERVGRSIENTKCGWNIPIHNQWQAQVAHDSQAQYDVRYADPR